MQWISSQDTERPVSPKEAIMKVLAFVDHSRYAASVCGHAAWAALRLGLPVEVLHVIEYHLHTTARFDRAGYLGVDTGEELLRELSVLDEQRNRIAQESGRLLLDDATKRLRAAGIDNARQRLEYGELVDRLRHLEGDARLIVMGKRGEAENQAEAHLGTNLERVIRASHRPVLIASPEFQPVRRFLLAWDGGKSSGAAINFLVDSMLLHEATGHVLFAGKGTDDERTRMSDAVRHLRSAGLEITDEIRDGEAGQVILDAVEREQSDLLVMGAYGHSRVRRLMIGSTTTEVVGACTASMLVFH
jgi:nucleotide-binding universal stress UspA family protein